jgi:hypothetical protein
MEVTRPFECTEKVFVSVVNTWLHRGTRFQYGLGSKFTKIKRNVQIVFVHPQTRFITIATQQISAVSTLYLDVINFYLRNEERLFYIKIILKFINFTKQFRKCKQSTETLSLLLLLLLVLLLLLFGVKYRKKEN